MYIIADVLSLVKSRDLGNQERKKDPETVIILHIYQKTEFKLLQEMNKSRVTN